MKNSFMFVSSVLGFTGSSAADLILAQQEKALRKEEFELSRRRLMEASARLQELKTKIYFAGKEVLNG